MKITKNQLRQIIKEELAQVLLEEDPLAAYPAPRDFTIQPQTEEELAAIRATRGATPEELAGNENIGKEWHGTDVQPTTDVRTMKGGVEVYGSGQAARNNPALKR